MLDIPELRHFYGKPIMLLKTTFTIDGGIKYHETIGKVDELKNNISPCSGCDIIINGCSCNSSDIYEIGGVGTTSVDILKLFGHLTIHNYCLPENFESLKHKHTSAIMRLIKEFIENTELILSGVKSHMDNDGMYLNLKVEKAQLLLTGGVDLINLTIDGGSSFPNMNDPTVIKIETQKGYGEEYCRTVLGLTPDIIDVN